MCLTSELKTAPGLGTGGNSVRLQCTICTICTICALFAVCVCSMAPKSWPNIHPRDLMYVPCLGKSKYWFWHFWHRWWLFTAALQKVGHVIWGLGWQLDLERKVSTTYFLDCVVKPLEEFLEIQPFQLEIQTHKSWLPPECQFYGDNPISYFPARHFQTLRSGKCF